MEMINTHTTPEPSGADPKISVIITCYNCREFIADSIKSVLGQTHQNLECIVVDDGSEDGTRAIVEQLQKEDPRLSYFYKPNGGAASARNFGFGKANGDWMQTLDGDDWIAPDKLERQLAAAREIESIGAGVLVYSDYEIVYEDASHQPVKRTPALIGKMTRDQLLRRVIGRQFGLATPSPLTMNSMLLSRNICKRHRFNESIQCAEDLEFYYRVLQTPIQCVYVPMCSMSYRQNMNSLSKDKKVSLIGYTDFLEAILKDNPTYLAYFPNLNKMIRRAYDFRDETVLERLRRILTRSRIPVYIRVKNYKIDIRLPVAAALKMRLWKLGVGMLLLKDARAKLALEN